MHTSPIIGGRINFCSVKNVPFNFPYWKRVEISLRKNAERRVRRVDKYHFRRPLPRKERWTFPFFTPVAPPFRAIWIRIGNPFGILIDARTPTSRRSPPPLPCIAFRSHFLFPHHLFPTILLPIKFDRFETRDNAFPLFYRNTINSKWGVTHCIARAGIDAVRAITNRDMLNNHDNVVSEKSNKHLNRAIESGWIFHGSNNCSRR